MNTNQKQNQNKKNNTLFTTLLLTFYVVLFGFIGFVFYDAITVSGIFNQWIQLFVIATVFLAILFPEGPPEPKLYR